MKPLQKYKPLIAKIIPWEQIENYYDNLISHGFELESMLSLVKFIRTNGFDKKLFGYIVQLEKLAITIYDPGEYYKETLYIEFNKSTQKWHFEYFPKPHEPSEAERYYDEDQGINKFCQFIEWLKW